MSRNGFHAVLVLSLLIAMAAPSLVLADETPSQEIIDAANVGMKAFIRAGDIGSFGLTRGSRKESLDDAVLGEALEIFTIPLQKLAPGMGRQCQPFYPEVESIITPTNMWVFSVGIHGKVTNEMIDVGLDRGKWTVYRFGTSTFPQLMHDLLTTWPRDAGYSLKFIRIHANRSMVEVSRYGKSLGIIFPEDDLKKLFQPSQVLPSLCATLKRNAEEDGRASARGEVLLR